MKGMPTIGSPEWNDASKRYPGVELYWDGTQFVPQYTDNNAPVSQDEYRMRYPNPTMEGATTPPATGNAIINTAQATEQPSDLYSATQKEYESLTDRLNKLDEFNRTVNPLVRANLSVANRVEGQKPSDFWSADSDFVTGMMGDRKNLASDKMSLLESMARIKQNEASNKLSERSVAVQEKQLTQAEEKKATDYLQSKIDDLITVLKLPENYGKGAEITKAYILRLQSDPKLKGVDLAPLWAIYDQAVAGAKTATPTAGAGGTTVTGGAVNAYE